MEEEKLDLNEVANFDQLADCVIDYEEAKNKLKNAQQEFDYAQEELIAAAIELCNTRP
jgi:hypothetical protein